jgi:hypothetical protein
MQICLIGIAYLQTSIERSEAGQFRHEIYPDKVQGAPLTFICQGLIYQPPLPLFGTNSTIDRSSPESLMENFFTAMKNKDTNLYNNLYIANEQIATLSAETGDHFDAMRLLEKIDYGSNTLIVFEASVNNQTGKTVRVLKLIGTNYYLSDALQEDRTYIFFYAFFEQTNLIHRAVQGTNGTVVPTFRLSYYAFTNTTDEPPLIIEYCGTNYTPSYPLHFTNLLRTNQDLSTPESALSAVFAAAYWTNLNWYLSLIVSNEVDAPFERITGLSLTIRQYVSNDLERVSRVLRYKQVFSIKSTIYFGDYALVTYQSRSGENDALVFKTDGVQWLLTDELNRGDMVRNLLMNERTPYTFPFYPKIMP